MRWPTAGASLDQVAPYARQQRARQPLQQVRGEERVAQHRDLLDQLAGAHPGELGRLDGAVERGGERREACALGGNRRRLGRRILGGRGPELLDLRSARRRAAGAAFSGGVGGVGRGCSRRRRAAAPAPPRARSGAAWPSRRPRWRSSAARRHRQLSSSAASTSLGATDPAGAGSLQAAAGRGGGVCAPQAQIAAPSPAAARRAR